MALTSRDQYGLIQVVLQGDDIEAGLKELIEKATPAAKKKAMRKSLKPVVKEMRNRVPKLHPDAGENKTQRGDDDELTKLGKRAQRQLKKQRRERTGRRRSGIKVVTKGQTKHGFKEGATSEAKQQKGGTMNLIKKSIAAVVRSYKKDGTSGVVVGVVGPRVNFYAYNRERIDKIAIGIEKGWKNRTTVPFMQDTLNATQATFPSTFKKELKKAYDEENKRVRKKLMRKAAWADEPTLGR